LEIEAEFCSAICSAISSFHQAESRSQPEQSAPGSSKHFSRHLAPEIVVEHEQKPLFVGRIDAARERLSIRPERFGMQLSGGEFRARFGPYSLDRLVVEDADASSDCAVSPSAICPVQEADSEPARWWILASLTRSLRPCRAAGRTRASHLEAVSGAKSKTTKAFRIAVERADGHPLMSLQNP
jgi:hypothetical protein